MSKTKYVIIDSNYHIIAKVDTLKQAKIIRDIIFKISKNNFNLNCIGIVKTEE